MKIRCYTLFDITETGVNSRRRHLETQFDGNMFDKQRNQQRNLETILQIISMRSQPEAHSIPTIMKAQFSDSSNWGYVYAKQKIKTATCWSFDFDINNVSVFDNGIESFGSLSQDCQGVPMITGLDELVKLPMNLDTSQELRNIYFEVVNY
jgi:hypothetical protein